MSIRGIAAAALSASVLCSVISVTAFARDAIPEEELPTYFDEGNHTLGIVGDFTKWGTEPDIVMTDPDGDGVYIGVVRDLTAGEYEFKVRSDSNWDDSWGEYIEEEDKTFNSLTNCSVTVDYKADVYITLDTNGDDCVVWPVSVYSTEGESPSKYGITGSMLTWGEGEPDSPMYEVIKGKYFGLLREVPVGTQEFRVRADSEWNESYGMYDPETDKTLNSQTNFVTEIPDSGYILVELDATGKDSGLWPVSFTAVNSSGNISDLQYTGKEIEDEPELSEEPSEESEDSQDSEKSEASPELSEESEEEIVIEISAEGVSETSESENSAAESSVPHSESSNIIVTGAASARNVTYAPVESPATGDSVVPVVLIIVSAAAACAAVMMYRNARNNDRAE